MTPEQYIEHEIQIRVLKETTDVKFNGIEKELVAINAKINWVLGVNFGCIFLSIFLKVIGVF